jgi:endogenous inhibitor of DNA gyrase (YacG/DUF329 family)
MPHLLPARFQFSHKFAFFLHDILASMVVSGERTGIFSVTINFESSSDAQAFGKLTGEELWNWLQANGYEWVTFQIAYKQTIIALLSDFSHFVYEALSCSQKGKLTVAYALLRKPFKENLFYLEWLLADPDDFKRKFHEGGADSLAVNLIKRERKLEVIEAAIRKTRFPDWVSAEFIYDLRYSKRSNYGFDSLWNKATHLITTFKAFRTEDENLNFVFSTSQAHLDQWHHLYSFVPLLLYHTVEVVEALITTITDPANLGINLDYVQRLAGFLLWVQDFYNDGKNQQRLNIPTIWNKLNLKCPKCGAPIGFDETNLKHLYERSKVKCRACGKKVKLNQEKVA